MKKILLFILKKISSIYGKCEQVIGISCHTPKIEIQKKSREYITNVDTFWSSHIVSAQVPFNSTLESSFYLRYRFKSYPLFKELMQLYGDHEGEIVLDYGCGPANDLLGFALFSKAQKIIGIDISEKALQIASLRLHMHNISSNRVQLIQISDSSPEIPLSRDSVDHIFCEGVLHHTTDPLGILKEFYRILKKDSFANVMVYNYNSIWLHLYTAYQKMILDNAFSGLNIGEAFSKDTDGVNCPIARCYKPEEFILLAKAANFDAEYKGGFFSTTELKCLKKYIKSALQNKMLAQEHRDFLNNLIYDIKGYPKYKNEYAGVGGVYRLYKK